MRLFTNYKADKRDKIFFILVGSISFLIFLHYLIRNTSVSYYDENMYVYIADKIIRNGLFHFDDGLRTYMYPLLISIFKVLSCNNLIITKIIMSVFQYSVFIYTILLLANTIWVVESNKTAVKIVILLGLINPYMIQATTLFLTDILAACLIVLSLLNTSTLKLNKLCNVFLSIGLLIISIMIRPSNLIFTPVIFCIIIIRFKQGSLHSYMKTFFAFFAQFLIFIPQLYNNVHYFNKWTPLIATDLYSQQTTWGASYIKYGTVVAPRQAPQLYYYNPFYSGNPVSMFHLMIENFVAFVFTFSAHVFGAFDWGYINTYITDFYSISRIFWSAVLYIFWSLIIVGVIVWTKKKFRIIKNDLFKSLDSNLLFMTISIAAALIYIVFIGTTAVESRFGYPIYLLLLIFSGYGVNVLVSSIHNSKTRLRKKFKVLLFFLLGIVIIVSCTILSFVMDYQTGRIDWKSYLMPKRIVLDLSNKDLRKPEQTELQYGLILTKRDNTDKYLKWSIGGKPIDNSEFIYTNSNSLIRYILKNGKYSKLEFSMGLDDHAALNHKGSVVYIVKGDGKVLFQSDIIKSGSSPKAVTVDIKGVKNLEMIVNDGGDDIFFDEAYWLNPVLIESK